MWWGIARGNHNGTMSHYQRRGSSGVVVVVVVVFVVGEAATDLVARHRKVSLV